jgi:hypothetical protein
MNPQIKQKWLNALRSGEYQQTKGFLRKEDGFCCLGILCDLYGKENNVEWNLTNNGHNYKFQESESYLPSSVMEWSGLSGNGKTLSVEQACSQLKRELIHVNLGGETNLPFFSGLNDSGSTFNEIADLIEEHL